jgi:hypothetical protein
VQLVRCCVKAALQIIRPPPALVLQAKPEHIDEPRSARPGRIEYDATEVDGLKRLVLEGQHVTVDGAERTVRAMPHPTLIMVGGQSI